MLPLLADTAKASIGIGECEKMTYLAWVLEQAGVLRWFMVGDEREWGNIEKLNTETMVFIMVLIGRSTPGPWYMGGKKS